MQKTVTTFSAAMVALACASALHAHHSGSMYQTTPVWVRGTVVRFEPINPHTLIALEGTSEDGEVSTWVVEGPGQSQLDRMGIGMDVPNVGDVIEFCAFPYRSAAELSSLFPGVDFSAPRWSRDAGDSSSQFVAGHVMVMPDGEKQFWEPHGVLGECIRSVDDQRQSWLDFLNSSSRAREAWCQQRRYTYVRSTASLQEFVEEINDSIDNPCE